MLLVCRYIGAAVRAARPSPAKSYTVPVPPSPSAVAATGSLATAVGTGVELLAIVAVVHRLVRQPMRARGLPTWTLGDTLLTSPLFFAGLALFLGATNGGSLAEARATGATVWWAAALAGLAAGAFGVRAFGKLY